MIPSELPPRWGGIRGVDVQRLFRRKTGHLLRLEGGEWSIWGRWQTVIAVIGRINLGST